MSIPDSDSSANPEHPTGFNPKNASGAQWAEEYRRLGNQVIPARGKVPAIAWKHLQNQLMSDDEFDALYGVLDGTFADNKNMGCILGPCSGHIFMLDLDTYKSAAAVTWWQGVLAVNNSKQELETWEQFTGGGGRQLFFKCPEGYAPQNATTDLDIDVRGPGGFAVLPPSLHASGKQYAWRPGHEPWEMDILVAPAWLCDEIDQLIKKHGGGKGPAPRTNGNGHNQDPEYTGFARLTNGRERYMRNLQFAAMTGYCNEGKMPGEPEMMVEWAAYERHCGPKTIVAGEDNAAGLEREKRGFTAFKEKWDYTLSRWNEEIVPAAAERKAREPQPAPPKIDPVTGEVLPLLLTAKQFLRGFVPPDYQVDGMLQKSYLYALTARPGHGKTAIAMLMASCIARGVSFHGHPTAQGRVLFLAGENPQDVRARYKVLADSEQFSPESIPFHFVDGVIDIAASMPKIREEAPKIGDLSLIVVDTATAYFRGDDSNSNAQQGLFAQLLRQLIKLPGAPAVVVNCHPVKNALQDNLIPLGGSNFLNEIDGNFTLWADDKTCVLNPHPAKWRGAPFEQIEFELRVTVSDTVRDSKGRHMPSVVAVPITEQGAERRGAVAEADEDTIMGLIHTHKTASMSEIAKKAGFVLPDGRPYKSKVQRIIERLKASKLIFKYRGSKYKLTKKGCKAAGVKWEQDENDD